MPKARRLPARYVLNSSKVTPPPRYALRLAHSALPTACVDYHVVGMVDMDLVVVAYRVHRLTVLRRMEQARRALGKETYRRLAARLTLSRTELDSIMRLIRSQLDVSLSVHLRGA